jgi:hypothetical protein
MNNSNGSALLARVREGALVTIRTADGRQTTGRAQWSELWRAFSIACAHNAALRESVTAGNITRVQP